MSLAPYVLDALENLRRDGLVVADDARNRSLIAAATAPFLERGFELADAVLDLLIFRELDAEVTQDANKSSLPNIATGKSRSRNCAMTWSTRAKRRAPSGPSSRRTERENFPGMRARLAMSCLSSRRKAASRTIGPSLG